MILLIAYPELKGIVLFQNTYLANRYSIIKPKQQHKTNSLANHQLIQELQEEGRSILFLGL